MKMSAVCVVLLIFGIMAGEVCQGQSPPLKVNPLSGDPITVTPTAANQQDQPLSGSSSSSIVPVPAPAPLVSNESAILNSVLPENKGLPDLAPAPAPATKGRRLLY